MLSSHSSSRVDMVTDFNVDKYLTAEQPWAEDKDPQRRANILWTAAEAIRVIATLAHPILPDATTKIWKLLGQNETISSQDLSELRWVD